MPKLMHNNILTKPINYIRINDNFCIFDTNIIYVHNNILTIKNLLANEVFQREVILPNLNIISQKKICISEDFNYIFILATLVNDLSIIIKINRITWELNILELNELFHTIYIFKNYILCVNIYTNLLLIKDFDNNLVSIFEEMNIKHINIFNDKNCIIVSGFTTTRPFTDISYLIDYNESTNDFIIQKELPNINSCYLDDDYFYFYNNNEQIINILDIKTRTINKISTQLNEENDRYKTWEFTKIFMLPDKIHMILNNSWNYIEIWNIKNGNYVGSMYERIIDFQFSFDNNYLISIGFGYYKVWKLDIGTFNKFKDFSIGKLPDSILDNIQSIIFKSNIK
jgi:hypothetical protein